MSLHIPLRLPLFNLIIFILLVGGCNNASDNNANNNTTAIVLRDADKVTIAFYNCENLFDTHHQPGKQDEDFTPDGKYHYTQRIYEQKLHNIATVLQGMNSGKDGAVAIAGLVEVENDRVLADLCSQPELGNSHYKHICHAGPDPRGINVALLYNPELFRVLKEESIPVYFTYGHKARTRDIMHVYGILAGDTVDILVNHWTSRTGGEDESERKRVSAAQTNKDAIADIMKAHPGTKVILMGDLNDNPTDRSVAVILEAKSSKEETTTSSLYNPFINIYNAGGGTEKFGGRWNLFDQIMLSGTWLPKQAHHFHFEKAEIYNPDFITNNYKKHSGEPHRSFAGGRWINGYSDHFPVMVHLAK